MLCIDGDVNLRNLDVFLGFGQTDVLSFLDICRGSYPLSAAAVHPEYPSLSFLTAPISGSYRDIPQEDLRKILELSRTLYDYIFIDGPAGLGEGFALYSQIADRCIVVTLPDPASIRCAGCAGEKLELLGVRNVRLVVNRIYSDMLKALKMNIDDIMDAVGLPLLGVVPSDPDVGFAAAKGKAMLSYSRFGATAAYKRIAKRIQGLSVPVSG